MRVGKNTVGTVAADPCFLSKELNVTVHKNMKQWKEAALRELKGRPLESLNWATPEGIVVKPIYTAVNATAARAAYDAPPPGSSTASSPRCAT